VQRLPELPHHSKARCLRCEAVLRRRMADPSRRALALGLAGAALIAPVLLTPLMDFDFRGQIRVASVFTGPVVLGQRGMAPVGLLVLAVVVLVPALRLAALLAVLLGLRMEQPPPGLAAVFRFYRVAARWSMIEIFLLGTFVAYNRLAQMATIELGPAMTALALLMLVSVAIDAVLDPDAVWDAIGRHARQPVVPAAPTRANGQIVGCPHCRLLVRAAGTTVRGCPRCGGALWRRKPASLARTWSLLIAAAILYIPANIYPVMTIVSFGRAYPSTILAGVDDLAAEGMWPLAVLVFFASITVPLLKLLGLGLLLVSTHRGWGARLRDRTRLYRIVEWIGRWSMIDVFAISLLVALIRMGLLASITPDPGAACFAAVVVLTMLAATSFDPRLMWDAAAQRAATDRAATRQPAIGQPAIGQSGR
jgi:paraquat-inducible protein A